MLKNYIITAWRNIIKNGMFSAINILGLAIGMMSCILIMLFVTKETGYDTWLKDSNRLVRMHTSYSMPNRPLFETVRSAGSMMEAIRDYASNEIETGVRFIQFGITIQKEDNGFSEQATMVDGSFFEVFDLPFVHGDKKSSFNKPMDLLISEELAIKYFGRTDVIGEMLTVCCVTDRAMPLKVTGVIKKLPDNTHLNTKMIIYLQPALFGENDGTLHTWTNLNVYTYFKLNEGVTANQLQERVNYWMDNESPLKSLLSQFFGDESLDIKVTNFVKQHIMPVTDLHLHAKKHAGNMGDLTPMGDIDMINTFTVVAALVLLIACINFMNLSTAKASKRAKEVAMRKVLGASRSQVAVQFLSEAIAIVLTALLFALVAVELVLPFYNEIIGKNLQLKLFHSPDLLLLLIGSAIFLGIIAGLYPALYLSRFLPTKILRGSKSAEAGNTTKLRAALVISQFTASIILVISTLVVFGQTVYSNTKDVGYQSENKLILSLDGVDNRQALKQSLLNLPEISSISFSSEAPSQDHENNNGFKLLEPIDGNVGEVQLLNYYNMDYAFFNDYQIKPIAGRLFDKAYGADPFIEAEAGEVSRGSVILNERALVKLGIKTPEQAIGKTLVANDGQWQLTIIGVVPDIHFRSIKFGIRASIYTLNPERYRVASLTYSTNNISTLITKIDNIWKNHMPMQPINLQFLSEMMAAQYHEELVTAQLFLVFAVLAIFIASLGLFGLSAFTVERRTKEIGIRKVMGASVGNIVNLLIWQFSKPVIIANVIAWPIAIYVMQQWLESYPYRIELWWLLPICLVVGLISLVIAWATVGGNAAKVARKKPVNSLRYE